MTVNHTYFTAHSGSMPLMLRVARRESESRISIDVVCQGGVHRTPSIECGPLGLYNTSEFRMSKLPFS